MYLRNRFMGGVSLLPFMDKENENGNDKTVEKTAEQLRQEERDSIDVNVSASHTNADGTDKDEDDDKSDTDNEDDNETDDEEEEEESDDNTNDKDKPDAETDEQKKERLAKAKEDRKEARIQKRIDKAVAEAKAAKEEAAKLKKQLEEKTVDGLTEEEVERRAEEKATAKLKEKQDKDAQAQFDKDVDNLAAEAEKVDKEFATKINEIGEDIGKIPMHMIGILTDLDNKNGGKVLAYLANNEDEYEDIISMSQHRMTMKLIRLSDKIKAEEKPVRRRSNAPEPITPVTESNRQNHNAALTGKEDMDTFVRKRNEQEANYRKSKAGF